MIGNAGELALGGGDPSRWEPLEPLRQGALRYVVSDFLSPQDCRPFLRNVVRGAAHLTVCHLLDPWEREPEPMGLASLTDSESEERLDIQLDDGAVSRYRERLARLMDGVQGSTSGVGGTFVPLTAAPPGDLFAKQLAPLGVVGVGAGR